MGPLNDENKLKFDEKNSKNYTKKLCKKQKSKKMILNITIKFKTIRSELTA